jgi:DNA/RNA-binding domain of Phe-tRNA-synthetase-like protein
LQAAYTAEQQATLARIGDTPLSDLPSLAAWRRAFTKFGVKPTQYRSACEALLRRLTKQGDIPSINTLVDIGNLVSIRYALPVAVVDRRAISGGITVHFADGTEQFTELGADEPEHPEPGEVVFTDNTKTVIARRWCWRQSAASAAREDTADAVITFEAQHEGSRADVEQAGQDLLALLQAYAGGEYKLSILSIA